MTDEGTGGTAGVVLAPDALGAEVLRRLVEEFVTRDGTDYGAVERSLAQKVGEVLAQIEAGEACVVFDPQTQTASIVPAADLAPAGG